MAEFPQCCDLPDVRVEESGKLELLVAELREAIDDHPLELATLVPELLRRIEAQLPATVAEINSQPGCWGG